MKKERALQAFYYLIGLSADLEHAKALNLAHDCRTMAHRIADTWALTEEQIRSGKIE